MTVGKAKEVKLVQQLAQTYEDKTWKKETRRILSEFQPLASSLMLLCDNLILQILILILIILS